MQKYITALLGLAIILTGLLNVPAFAANDKFVFSIPPRDDYNEKDFIISAEEYNNRVQNLKDSYGVTFGKAKYPEQDSQVTQVSSLESVEHATKIIGSSATRKIAGYWIKANGKFSVMYGTNDKQNSGAAMTAGFFIDGTVTFLPTSAMHSAEYATSNGNVILHEIGHAYDRGVLQNGGSNTFAEINGSYVQERYSQSKYLGQNSSAGEDFADTFRFMLTDEVPLLDVVIYADGKTRNISKNDLVYKKCEALYEFMLRDFGADSAAVKRAARFLGK